MTDAKTDDTFCSTSFQLATCLGDLSYTDWLRLGYIYASRLEIVGDVIVHLCIPGFDIFGTF